MSVNTNIHLNVRGNVTSVSNSLSKIDFEYEHFDGGDVVSRVHSYGIGDGVDLPDESLAYEFNEVGDRIKMSTKLGNFYYLRDTAGRLKSITNPKGDKELKLHTNLSIESAFKYS